MKSETVTIGNEHCASFAMTYRSSRFIALLVVFFLAACAETEKAEYEKVDPRARHVMFSSPLLVDTKPAVFAMNDARSQREFTIWRGSGASANFWYGSTMGLWWRDQEHMTEEMLRRWKELKDEDLDISDHGVAPSRLGAIDYWRFTMGRDRQCFGINHFWSPSVNDGGGYREWLNGYYCHPPNEPLTDREVEEMVSRLTVRREIGAGGTRWRN